MSLENEKENPIYLCPITSDRKLLLFVLGLRGEEPISVNQLAQLTSINEDDTNDLLDSLQALGLIKIDRHAAPTEWTLTNVYKVQAETIQAWADQAGEMP